MNDSSDESSSSADNLHEFKSNDGREKKGVGSDVTNTSFDYKSLLEFDRKASSKVRDIVSAFAPAVAMLQHLSLFKGLMSEGEFERQIKLSIKTNDCSNLRSQVEKRIKAMYPGEKRREVSERDSLLRMMMRIIDGYDQNKAPRHSGSVSYLICEDSPDVDLTASGGVLKESLDGYEDIEEYDKIEPDESTVENKFGPTDEDGSETATEEFEDDEDVGGSSSEQPSNETQNEDHITPSPEATKHITEIRRKVKFLVNGRANKRPSHLVRMEVRDNSGISKRKGKKVKEEKPVTGVKQTKQRPRDISAKTKPRGEKTELSDSYSSDREEIEQKEVSRKKEPPGQADQRGMQTSNPNNLLDTSNPNETNGSSGNAKKAEPALTIWEIVELIGKRSRSCYPSDPERKQGKPTIYNTKFFHFMKKYITMHNWLSVPGFSFQNLQRRHSSRALPFSGEIPAVTYGVHPETLLKMNNHELNVFCMIIQRTQKKRINAFQKKYWYFALYFYTYLVLANYEAQDREHVMGILNALEESFCPEQGGEDKSPGEPTNTGSKNLLLNVGDRETKGDTTSLQDLSHRNKIPPKSNDRAKRQKTPAIVFTGFDLSFDLEDQSSSINLYNRGPINDSAKVSLESDESYFRRRFDKYRMSLIDLSSFLNFLMVSIPNDIYQLCCDLLFINMKDILSSLREILRLFRTFIYEVIVAEVERQSGRNTKEVEENSCNEELFPKGGLASFGMETECERSCALVFLVELYSILYFEFRNIVKGSDSKDGLDIIPNCFFAIKRDVLKRPSPISRLPRWDRPVCEKKMGNLFDLIPKPYIETFPNDNSLYLSTDDVLDPAVLCSKYHVAEFTYKHNIYTQIFKERHPLLNLGNYISIPCGSEGKDRSAEPDDGESDRARLEGSRTHKCLGPGGEIADECISLGNGSSAKYVSSRVVSRSSVAEFNSIERGPFLIPTNTNYYKCEQITVSWNIARNQFQNLTAKVVNRLYVNLFLLCRRNAASVRHLVERLCSEAKAFYISDLSGEEETSPEEQESGVLSNDGDNEQETEKEDDKKAAVTETANTPTGGAGVNDREGGGIGGADGHGDVDGGLSRGDHHHEGGLDVGGELDDSQAGINNICQALEQLKNMLNHKSFGFCSASYVEVENFFKNDTFLLRGFTQAELDVIAKIYNHKSRSSAHSTDNVDFGRSLLGSCERLFMLSVRLTMIYMEVCRRYNSIVWRNSPDQ